MNIVPSIAGAAVVFDVAESAEHLAGRHLAIKIDPFGAAGEPVPKTAVSYLPIADGEIEIGGSVRCSSKSHGCSLGRKLRMVSVPAERRSS